MPQIVRVAAIDAVVAFYRVWQNQLWIYVQLLEGPSLQAPGLRILVLLIGLGSRIPFKLVQNRNRGTDVVLFQEGLRKPAADLRGILPSPNELFGQPLQLREHPFALQLDQRERGFLFGKRLLLFVHPLDQFLAYGLSLERVGSLGSLLKSYGKVLGVVPHGRITFRLSYSQVWFGV